MSAGFRTVLFILSLVSPGVVADVVGCVSVNDLSLFNINMTDSCYSCVTLFDTSLFDVELSEGCV